MGRRWARGMLEDFEGYRFTTYRHTSPSVAHWELDELLKTPTDDGYVEHDLIGYSDVGFRMKGVGCRMESVGCRV
jgi:hypothetical protein